MKKLILYRLIMMMGIAIIANSCEPLEPDEPDKAGTISGADYSILFNCSLNKLTYTPGETAIATISMIPKILNGSCHNFRKNKYTGSVTIRGIDYTLFKKERSYCYSRSDYKSSEIPIGTTPGSYQAIFTITQVGSLTTQFYFSYEVR